MDRRMLANDAATGVSSLVTAKGEFRDSMRAGGIAPDTALPEVLIRASRPDLQRFVQRLQIVSFPQAAEDLHFPGPGLVAAIHLGGHTRLDAGGLAPAVGLTGLFDRARRHQHASGAQILLVAFTPIGAAALLGVPADEVRNATIDLRALSKRLALQPCLPVRLAAAAGCEEKIRLTENWLASLLPAAEPDRLVEAAVARIGDGKGVIRIDRLARAFELSESAFTRRFKSAVGAPPKRYASIVRVQHVLRLAGSGGNLTQIAMEAGYFDQAHFIRDFRAIAGSAPGRILKA
jgi:AraC-like DNA-binding protein